MGVFLTPIGFKPDTSDQQRDRLEDRVAGPPHPVQRRVTIARTGRTLQIGLFDPGVLGNLTFTTNGPDYRVKGFETESRRA